MIAPDQQKNDLQKKDLQRKRDLLIERLRGFGRVAVAFSGGVDSSCLAAVAYEALGDESVAVTVSSPLLPEDERADALEMARRIGIRHVVVEMDELEDARFAANPPDKWYICKKMRFTRMAEWAAERNIPWILDGSNADDTKDYRPGMKALAEIANVRSPLLEAGLTKRDIRELSRGMDLFTWNKPARACLASRLPYGETITEAKLRRIEAAEAFLSSLLPSRSQFRVRSHDDLARIEMDMADAWRILPERAEAIHDELKRLGFRYVALDLKGYRMGSLNEGIERIDGIEGIDHPK